MATKTFTVGQDIRIRGVFSDPVTHKLVAPDTAVAVITPPIGDSVEVLCSRDERGGYAGTFTPSEPGEHTWHMTGSGQFRAFANGRFNVATT